MGGRREPTQTAGIWIAGKSSDIHGFQTTEFGDTCNETDWGSGLEGSKGREIARFRLIEITKWYKGKNL